MSDDLSAGIRRHDCQTLAQFIEEHRPQLMAFIERQLGAALRRKVEPDDIFQETSAEACRALPSTELGDRDPFSWLCQVAEHRIIDLHRRHFGAQKRDAGREVSLATPTGDQSQQAELVNMLIASMTTPSQVFARNTRQACLVEALAKLPDDQREAIRLRYVENLPSKEIAERLKKTDAAIRVMLTRSLKKLQELLANDVTRTSLG